MLMPLVGPASLTPSWPHHQTTYVDSLVSHLIISCSYDLVSYLRSKMTV
jgi:hypothetical protein